MDRLTFAIAGASLGDSSLGITGASELVKVTLGPEEKLCWCPQMCTLLPEERVISLDRREEENSGYHCMTGYLYSSFFFINSGSVANIKMTGFRRLGLLGYCAIMDRRLGGED